MSSQQHRCGIDVVNCFGGFVALTYAALFPDHPGGVILANTTGGHRDQQRVIEAFRRVGDEAAAAIQRSFTEDTEEADAEFKRVCCPLYSGKPGWTEESRLGRARTITSLDVSEDDPICPLPVVEELASRLPAETTPWCVFLVPATPSSATARTSLSRP